MLTLKWTRTLGPTALGMMLVAGIAFGQSERGAITGTVHDESGAVVVAAKVTVTETATGTILSLVSNDSGDYTGPNLSVGVYLVRVEKEGFRAATMNGVVLNAGATARADFTLQVGAATQSVEVQAQAVTLSTDSATTSATVVNKLVDELPLVVSGGLRSPFDLSSLTPEAKSIGGVGGYVLGGGQAASYGAQLDGISVNTTRALRTDWVAVNTPSLDAITEFSVDTNGFKAEYGRAGGGVISFVAKSGTNALHGSAYEFLRNTELDANNWFNNRAGLSRPVYKQHDFGASLGGPVWIPKLYNGKNRTFFFFAYEGFRNRAGATGVTTTIPTPEMYQGDFHNWVDSAGKMIPLYDPTTQTTNAAGAVSRQPFPNNLIPLASFDPIAVAAVKTYQESGVLRPNNGAPPGTVGYAQNNYFIANGSNIAPQNKWSVKADQNLGSKDRLSFFFMWSTSYLKPGPGGPPTLPGNYQNYNDSIYHSPVLRGSWDHVFSPTLFNHAYVGGNNWTEDHAGLMSTIRSGLHWKEKVCAPNVPDCDQNILQLNFSNGYSTWGSIADNGSENVIISYNDDLTWVRGKHTFKFGGSHLTSHYNGFGRQCIAGCATFSFLETGQPGNTNFTTAGGNPFASFLLGWADAGSLETVRFIGQQWSYFAGFAQDDFRVRPNLTLNLGLRWETTLPPTFADDHMSDFSPTTPNPAAGGLPGAMLFAGDGPGRTGARSLADSYFKSFGPHVGFAYSFNNKTVVRGGYSRTFGAVTTTTGSTHQLGFVAQNSFTNNGSNGVTPSFVLAGGFPAWAPPPSIDPGVANTAAAAWYQGAEATHPPEDNNWSLSIQRQLAASTRLEVAYNGVAGSHLVAGLMQYNQVNPIYLQQYGAALLNSQINSAAAIAAGIRPPWPGFQATYTSGGVSKATVAQALKPFPQFNTIDTVNGGGDHSGHSTYHSGTVRIERRSGIMTLQASYVFSKLLTDADSYSVGGGNAAMDFYNRGLEKSIGAFDITHNVKIGQVLDLPFGHGRRFLSSGFLGAIVGNWRISSIQYYASGQPLGLSTSVSLPLGGGANRPTIPTYDGWRAPQKGDGFDPSLDRFVQPASFFGPQPATFGNQTRFNPKLRQFANLNENISIARTFLLHEQTRLDLRAEAFNIFNRQRFGTGSLSLQSNTFGQLTSAGDLLNTPRSLQVALKVYF